MNTHAASTVSITPIPDQLAPTVTIDGHDITPYKRGQVTYVPVLCDIGTFTLDKANEDLHGVQTEGNVHPGGDEDLSQTLQQITSWARQRGFTRVLDLSGVNATALLKDLCQVDDLSFTLAIDSTTNPHDIEAESVRIAAALDLAHKLRNMLLAMRIIGVTTNPRTRKQRHNDDAMDAHLPVLPPRWNSKGRPATDDEMHVYRLGVTLDILEEDMARSITTRLLVADGIPVTHASLTTRLDLDDPEAPTKVSAARHASRVLSAAKVGDPVMVAPRNLPLTEFSSRSLGVVLEELPAALDTNITYGGTAMPGSNAARTNLNCQISRFLTRIGLGDPLLTPLSISRWRAKNAIVHGRPLSEARLYLGGTTQNLLHHLGLERVPAKNDKMAWLKERYPNPKTFSCPIRDYGADQSTTRKNRLAPVEESWDAENGTYTAARHTTPDEWAA